MGEVIRDGRVDGRAIRDGWARAIRDRWARRPTNDGHSIMDSQRQPATGRSHGSMQPHYQHPTAGFLSLAT
jgi:hypothetical protein